MKNMILILSFFFLITGCEKEKETDPQENSIYGTWQLVKRTSNNSDGSPNDWVSVSDGYSITFEEDLSYKSEINPLDCNEIYSSTFEIRKESENKVLEIVITCTKPNLVFRSKSNYSFFDSNNLILIPTWGIKRNIGNHLTYETGIGIGYRYVLAKRAGYIKNEEEEAFNLHLRIGYRF